jgi:3-oxoacyl-[acyl-carrier-protein] synthase II
MTDKLRYFINGVGIISPQKTYDNQQFLTEISTYDQNVLNCVTPDFKSFINPIQLRRLNRMLRVGLSAAIICLRDARVNSPEGIITATGYGFLEETEKFLTEVFERQEKQLTPTYFMQGTYNALAGLVALSIKCTGYNNTYVSKGFAFENALRDAMLQVAGDLNASYLVGAFDEAASVQYIINSREHHYKAEHINNLTLFESSTTGSIQGEGAAFFSISGTASDTTWCVLHDMYTAYRPEDAETLASELTAFLATNKTPIGEIDAWISGVAGDTTRDLLLTTLANSLLDKTPQIRFKHLCGEYCTAASFALWLGASVLKHQHVPEIVKYSALRFPQQLNTILVINHYMNRNYSFCLLKKV